MKARQVISVLIIFHLVISKASFAVDNTVHPVLVLATAKNFGYFVGEILKTEGFNGYQLDSLTGGRITLKYLQQFDIVILAETALNSKQQKMLSRYVKSGGNLIAFKPDKKLNAVFGIKDAGGTIAEAYVSIDNNTEVGNGITSQPLQFHGEAGKYTSSGAGRIAAFYTNAKTGTAFPAVVINNYGKGHAMAFLYNLPESIVSTRQGNYRYADKETDGILGLRAMDLFTNGWVDTNNNTINQADEQMRLLSHGIEVMSRNKRPIPRFWYFPDTLKCLVTLNNDGEDSKEEEFYKQFADVDSMGAKMTLYVKEADLISKDWVNKWIKKGFEISGHPDDTKQAVNPDWNTMDSVYKTLQKKLNSAYGINVMKTITNHWFVWCGKYADGTLDFAAQARLEENNGIGLDCNYAHYDNNSNQGHFLGSSGIGQGNYTGSGFAMKFSDINGNIINVYQQLNNVYDQQYMEHKDQDGYYNCFKGLMDRSISDEVYSIISVRAHNNEYFFSKIPLMKMLAYANSNSIPVWTEEKLLDFLKAKDEAAFTDIQWEESRLSFNIKSSLTHSNNISFIVPFSYGKEKISNISVNGKLQPVFVKTIKGFDYTMITVKPGADYKIEISYKDKG